LAHRIGTFLVAILTLLSCLAAHEFGHVLAACLTGGVVRDFVLFSIRPHVAIAGAATHAQDAIRAAGGSVCSLLACLGFLLAAPARWRLVKDTTTAFGCVELVGWSLSSLVREQSRYPDDAERFLAASGANAYHVVAVCALIAFAGFIAFRLSERARHKHMPTYVSPSSSPRNKAAAAAN
jgi:hypothetical protein